MILVTVNLSGQKTQGFKLEDNIHCEQSNFNFKEKN